MLDLYIEQSGKRLRCGYTTGSCAAGAAKAAVLLLLTGKAPKTVSIDTPKGIPLTLDVLEQELVEGHAACAIRKDSGDDPDITNGILIYAVVEKCLKGISIHGGKGVGRVTKPGLDQPVGASAINSVPRQMIREACEQAARQHGYDGGFVVEIRIPDGEELAKRTFNPRLGIEGGLSVIGTTGIVEPMSNAALLDTIRLELKIRAQAGEKAVLLTPGNYGEDFARDVLHLDVARQVTCSNFIGEAIDAAINMGFQKICLIGHIGKLVKLGIGMLNTHSAYGDGRMETLAACGLEAGADSAALREVLKCVSTDGALEVLKKAGILRESMEALGRRIDATLCRKVPEGVEIGYVCFTKVSGLFDAPNESGSIQRGLQTTDAGEDMWDISGVLAMSRNAQKLLEIWRKRNEE